MKVGTGVREGGGRDDTRWVVKFERDTGQVGEEEEGEVGGREILGGGVMKTRGDEGVEGRKIGNTQGGRGGALEDEVGGRGGRFERSASMSVDASVSVLCSLFFLEAFVVCCC